MNAYVGAQISTVVNFLNISSKIVYEWQNNFANKNFTV